MVWLSILRRARRNERDAVEENGVIKHRNIALGLPSTTLSDECLQTDQKILDDTRIVGDAEETERRN